MKALLAAASLLLLTGCMSLADFGTVREYPAQGNSKAVISIATKIYGPQFGDQTIHTFQLYYHIALDGEEDQIVLQKIVSPEKKAVWRLHHEYYGEEPRHMTGLTFVVDGETVALTDQRPLYSEPGGKVDENLFYTVDEIFLDRLSRAKDVQLQYFGPRVPLTPEAVALLGDALGILRNL